MPPNGRADPDTHAPSFADSESGISRAGWAVVTRKLPILRAAPLEAMSERLGIAVPEMIFGNNVVRLAHAGSGWAIEFNAFDALDRVDKTGAAMLQVAHSREWQSTRQEHHESIQNVIKPFDWSYTTDYAGTVSVNGSANGSEGGGSSDPSGPAGSQPDAHSPASATAAIATATATAGSETKPLTFRPVTTPIPLELLKRPDPILFFDELVLYEDEMADNGITMLSAKVRVMPDRLLLLVRFFLRLDGVLVRLRDTRVFVEFATGQVLREYTAREAPYEEVRQALLLSRQRSSADDVLALLRDPNALAEVVPVVERRMEEVKVL